MCVGTGNVDTGLDEVHVRKLTQELVHIIIHTYVCVPIDYPCMSERLRQPSQCVLAMIHLGEELSSHNRSTSTAVSY